MLGAAPGRRLRDRAPARYVPLDPSDRHSARGSHGPCTLDRGQGCARKHLLVYLVRTKRGPRALEGRNSMYELITVALTIGAFTVGYAAPAVLGDILNRRSERAAD